MTFILQTGNQNWILPDKICNKKYDKHFESNLKHFYFIVKMSGLHAGTR